MISNIGVKCLKYSNKPNWLYNRYQLTFLYSVRRSYAAAYHEALCWSKQIIKNLYADTS